MHVSPIAKGWAVSFINRSSTRAKFFFFSQTIPISKLSCRIWAFTIFSLSIIGWSFTLKYCCKTGNFAHRFPIVFRRVFWLPDFILEFFGHLPFFDIFRVPNFLSNYLGHPDFFKNFSCHFQFEFSRGLLIFFIILGFQSSFSFWVFSGFLIFLRKPNRLPDFIPRRFQAS